MTVRVLWSTVAIVFLLAGCASDTRSCSMQDIETISWVHEGYVESIWHRVQVPPPGQTGLVHDPGLGADAYILKWGARDAAWDVPNDEYEVDEWTSIPTATYSSLDGTWEIAFTANETVVRLQTGRDPATDGSLVQEMQRVARSLAVVNQSQEIAIIDKAVHNATPAGGLVMLLPGPPRIGHLWNESGGVQWELTRERDIYIAHASPWTFTVDVNGIDVDRPRGPDHHVDLMDRVYASPEELDPDRFPRLTEEPRDVLDAIGWFQVLAVMPDVEPTGVLVAADTDCTLASGIGRLPDPAAAAPRGP